MSNAHNIAARLEMGIAGTDGVQCLNLLALPLGTSVEGIARASGPTLNQWAADVRRVARAMGEAQQYWESIAAEMEHRAREKCTGVKP
jgi:hypothetical protein